MECIQTFLTPILKSPRQKGKGGVSTVSLVGNGSLVTIDSPRVSQIGRIGHKILLTKSLNELTFVATGIPPKDSTSNATKSMVGFGYLRGGIVGRILDKESKSWNGR